MARKVRLFFENTAQHIVLRGVNQESVFMDHDDYTYGLDVLKELSVNLLVHVHAYVLMPNHLHLLCTSFEKDAISRFMQGFGIKYVAYYNRKYGRSGTLWEGRYKSSLVENRFVLPLMHYIESHPYRTGHVSEMTPYMYSSFTHNASARVDGIVTSHSMYTLLASIDEERARVYASLYKQGLSEALMHFFKQHIVKQTITGTQEFYQELAQKIGLNLNVKKVGRPIKKSTFQRSNAMYQNLVVLDREKHKNLKISPMANLNFAKSLTSTPLLANEAALVAKDFPVVFTGSDTPALVALTSLGGTNLAINSEGKYIVSYVPAFLRSYPFTLGKNQENAEQQLILIDEGSELVSQTKGKQLFTKEGEQSEALSNAITFLQNFEVERQKTEAIVSAIAQSGILEDREITVGEGESKKILVNGFRIINREKLNALGDDVLADWVRRGIISFIDAHSSSLNHIQTLFNLASTKQ